MSTKSTLAKNLLVRFVEKSSNRKTGPIPVSSSQASTCSPVCPFNKGDDGRVLSENSELPKCYGGFGNTAVHWRSLTNRKAATSKNVTDFDGFLKRVKTLPEGQLWRHNEVGDLPHIGKYIDPHLVKKLATANHGKHGFTYTHHFLNAANVNVLRETNAAGFTVNVSANSISELPSILKLKLPTVTILPSDAPNVQYVEDTAVVACPAEKSDKVTCANCGICADSDRDYVIGFRAHGSGKKAANIIAKG